MKTILFQGDSITDAGRNREDENSWGLGYPLLISASMGMDRQEEFRYINKGISGNRIIDVLARVKIDIINLKPDYLSILLGVNDVWHEFKRQNGVDTERFEQYYNMLIEQIKEALPDIKIMIMEPFALCGSATEEQWEAFRSEVEQRAAAAERVAEKQGLLFLPLMEKFDRACETAPADYWLEDGVHPTARGHELIRREWMKAFEQLEQM